MNVLIAGGTGNIGVFLQSFLEKQGHQVKVLSRSKKGNNIVSWDPSARTIDLDGILDTEVIVNLCGAGIAEQRWTIERKQELLESRMTPAEFLFDLRIEMPFLKHYIGASGISCYGFDRTGEPYMEDDEFGLDFTSQLVRRWELCHDLFEEHVPVMKLRIAPVLTKKGGILEKMGGPVKKGFGAALGSGVQPIQWIHVADIAGIITHGMKLRLSGNYNLSAGNVSNKEFLTALAKAMGKKIRLPRVPGLVVRMLFGELADILLNGVNVSNDKITQTGYRFHFADLDSAMEEILRQ